MKIYQLHEHSGEYEDYSDCIIGSYLKPERAEEEKLKAEAKEKKLAEQGIKCRNCPFLSANRNMPKQSDYCTEMELEEDIYGVECANYYPHWDKSYFKIEEVEVEE